jgi:hypothetical protein
MGLFTKKVKEVSALEMLDKIDIDVNDMAGKIMASGDKQIQMIHMSGVNDANNDVEGKGRCLAVIGSPEGLIEMLYSAALKEKHFAKILFTVTESLSNSREEMAKLRSEVALGVNGPCECPACQAEANGTGVPLNDIENMSPEQMDELVKGIMGQAIGKAKRG